MKKICGSYEKMFVVINSTNYNDDGVFQVVVAPMSELPELGFDNYDLKEIDKLSVDDKYQTDFVGCYVIRIG